VDTTAKYILMSAKAEKLQKELHKWNSDTSFWEYDIEYRSQGYCTKHECLIREGPDGGEDCPKFLEMWKDSNWEDKVYDTELCDDVCWIVLPHQDQLQRMVSKNRAVEELIGDFYGWFRIFLSKDSLSLWFDNYTTMEQLWLAFCMHELYNKVWDGKDWKENGNS